MLTMERTMYAYPSKDTHLRILQLLVMIPQYASRLLLIARRALAVHYMEIGLTAYHAHQKRYHFYLMLAIQMEYMHISGISVIALRRPQKMQHIHL